MHFKEIITNLINYILLLLCLILDPHFYNICIFSKSLYRGQMIPSIYINFKALVKPETVL